MLHNHLIIVPFILPWERAADYQRQTCVRLSKHHNTVVAYVHKRASFFLKKRTPTYIKDGVIFFSPTYIIPLQRFVAIERLNQLLNLWWITFRYGLTKKTILWVFDPFFKDFPLLLPRQQAISIYDCVDYHDSRDASLSHQIRENEKKLMSRVKHFFTNSQTLYHLHQHYHPVLVPQGFDLEAMMASRENKSITSSHPIIGFVGAVNARLDLPLLDELSTRHSQWSFVFVGPKEKYSISAPEKKLLNTFFSKKNVLWYEAQPRQKIASIINQFDVCIIPYRTEHNVNKYSFPMKLLEYFYLQKPVLSTPIVEMKYYKPLVLVAKNTKDWSTKLKLLLSQQWPSKYQRKQRAIAEYHQWSNKLEVISRVIEHRAAA